MIEQNTAAAKNAIALAIVHSHPVRIELGHTVGAAGIKRGFFNLWNSLHLAKHFRGAGLVKANFGIDQPNGFQQVQGTQACNLCRGRGLIKTHTHKTLRSQVVDFLGAYFLNQSNARS